MTSVVLALAALAGLVALISSRDRSTLTTPQGPGRLLPDSGDAHLAAGAHDPRYATNPPASGAHVVTTVRRDEVRLSNDELLTALEQGDVVLVYRDGAQAPALRSLARTVAGPFYPAVAAAGQAVVLDHLATAPKGSVTALAWRHEATAGAASDPALRAFAQFWLGRGAGTAGRR